MTRRQLHRATGHDQIKSTRRLFARATPVFHADQVEGSGDPSPLPQCRQSSADAFIAATGAEIVQGGGLAFYNMRSESIQIPERSRFNERTHWTSPALRCNRDLRAGLAAKRTRWRNWSPSLELPSFVRSSASASNPARITPSTLPLAWGDEGRQARHLQRRFQGCRGLAATARRDPVWLISRSCAR
uniref:Polyvalent protein metallopeptidase domain-containing protein n=1 Tax=Rhodopseudomonas palustris (strain BisA53) TaxID=316055 RepID=Q07SJ3_RHOP5